MTGLAAISGHVDGIGHARISPRWWELRIRAPQSLGKYLPTKGSITVNGVSLTVNRVQDLAGDTQKRRAARSAST
jgi:riboflavin synthase